MFLNSRWVYMEHADSVCMNILNELYERILAILADYLVSLLS